MAAKPEGRWGPRSKGAAVRGADVELSGDIVSLFPGSSAHPRFARYDQSTLFHLPECFRIQLETSSRTAGETVSSMPPYSLGKPVMACWNRWFRSGSSSA